MEVQQDFKELLELFNCHGVEYLIVGAYALAIHGVPRYTGDIDILINPVAGNAARVIKVLIEFGFGSVGLSEADFLEPGKVIQLGFPPVRIDIITSISGVTWDKAFGGKVAGMFGDISVQYIGMAELIENKKASGRRKDLADLEAIGVTDL